MLDKYFASYFEIEGPGVLPTFHDRNFDQILSYIDVNEELIWKAVHRLKPFKLQGPDNLHPKLIKECKASLIQTLNIIFKRSIQEPFLPEIWKQANVTATR